MRGVWLATFTTAGAALVFGGGLCGMPAVFLARVALLGLAALIVAHAPKEV